MDDQLVALDGDEYDDLEQVRRPIRPDDEPPIRVLAEIVDHDRVLDRVQHVVIGDAVAEGRRVDLHTALTYYESCEALTVTPVRHRPMSSGELLDRSPRRTRLGRHEAGHQHLVSGADEHFSRKLDPAHAIVDSHDRTV